MRVLLELLLAERKGGKNFALCGTNRGITSKQWQEQQHPLLALNAVLLVWHSFVSSSSTLHITCETCMFSVSSCKLYCYTCSTLASDGRTCRNLYISTTSSIPLWKFCSRSGKWASTYLYAIQGTSFSKKFPDWKWTITSNCPCTAPPVCWTENVIDAGNDPTAWGQKFSPSPCPLTCVVGIGCGGVGVATPPLDKLSIDL
jgi:hypothetical protein